jgi:hypothetical protein
LGLEVEQAVVESARLSRVLDKLLDRIPVITLGRQAIAL